MPPIDSWDLYNKGNVDGLIAALRDRDEFTRMTAAGCLGELRAQKALPALVEALDDDSVDVCHRAVEALGQIGDPRAVEPLMDTLRHDRRLRLGEEAARALGSLGDDRAVEALCEALTYSSDANVRDSAAAALGEVGGSRAADALAVALHDEDGNVSRSASIALKRIGDHRTKIRLSRDREWSKRETQIVGEYKHPEYRPGSGPGFQSGDTVDADMASEYYEDPVHRWYERRREEEAPRLAEARRELEGRWQDQEARWLREDGVGASEVGPRCEACHAPVARAGFGPICPYCGFEMSSREEGSRVRRRYRDSPDHWKTKRLVRELVTYPRSDGTAHKVTRLGSEAVPELMSALDYEDEVVRSAVAKVLGDIGDERAVPALTGFVERNEGDLREQALWALDRIGGPRAAEALAAHRPDEARRLVEDLVTATRDRKESARDKAARKLTKLGSDAIPHLVSALDEEDDAVRWMLATVLGDIGDPSAADALTALLQDEDEGVREAASVALEHIESH